MLMIDTSRICHHDHKTYDRRLRQHDIHNGTSSCDQSVVSIFKLTLLNIIADLYRAVVLPGWYELRGCKIDLSLSIEIMGDANAGFGGQCTDLKSKLSVRLVKLWMLNRLKL